MKNLLFCLFALFLTVGCNEDKKQVEALQNETEAIHDEAMKDMAEMNRIGIEIKKFMIAASMTPEQSAVFTTTLTNIGNAENDMMAWMPTYKKPTDMPAPEAMKYLTEKKAQITKIHADIKAAAEAGKKLLPQ